MEVKIVMKKFRRILSIVLSILMVASVAAFSASAATEETIPAGTQILFDNTATQWTDVYIYGWQYGFAGEFLPMTKTATANIYSYTLPEAVPVNSEFCLFVNQAGWAGATQTKNVKFTAPATEQNTVVPAAGTSPLDYTWAYNAPPAPAPYVSATPSKSFATEMDVVLYTNIANATYSLDGGVTEIAYTDGTIIHITETTTVTLVGTPVGSDPIIAEYTYTKVGATTITATVTGGYDGPVYAYLFGGDRIGAAFYLMTKDGNNYTYSFEGAAQVIFTTTNDWATAEKLNSDEPLVAAGTTAHFDLVHA